jgi:DNA polymerase III subunit epsilon
LNNENKLFAVVDVETTGGKPTDTKITEIAIIISDGKSVIEEYTTLVNPYRRIDWFVTKLTGITDEMVATAPSFEDSSDRIKELLEGKIFVAHNVDFDYGIIKREFLELGKPLDLQKLCTVKSARKVFQHLSSYSLGNLSAYLGIDLPNAHRALDDTRATADLLHRILEKESFEFLYSELKHQNHEVELPADWKINQDKVLDNHAGIVYFHNEEGGIIYLDSSKNMKKYVYNVVNNAEKKDILSRRLVEQVKSISLDELKDEFKAEIKAMNEIQVHKPKFNKPFKAQSEQFTVFVKKDEKGLYFLSISRTKQLGLIDGPIIYSASFKNAEKLKLKFNQSPEIAQLVVLKKQIHADDGPIQQLNIREYNKAFLDKLHKEYCCSFKNGYYIFNIYGENEFEAICVENHYLKSWGQGKLENNQVISFNSEFDFDINQKITRKFLNILGKTSYKLLKT